MNKVLVQIYQTTASKYIKFRKRLHRNISKGRFRKFTKKKQSQLLSKVERLRRRVAQLETQLRLAGASVALSLILNATPAEAQTTLGPFQRNYFDNPLPPPLRPIENPSPTYIDLDGDSDLDLIVGDEYSHKLLYFKNIRSQSNPLFVEIQSTDPEYPFPNITTTIGTNRDSWSPSFTDVDMDGDYDLLVGTDKYSPVHEGKTFFFRNDGTATQPNFIDETQQSSNPFAGVQSYRLAHPTFADVDNDGDVDLILGGYYDTSTDHYLIQFYRNDKINPVDPNEAPNFVQVINHPFEFNNINQADAAPVSFADLDKDGDLDFFFNIYGTIRYRRNEGNGIFIDQTGPWMPDAGNPGNSSGNPFNTINLVDPYQFVFSDLDNDGDLDATVGYYIDNSGNEEPLPFLYYENIGQGVLQLREELESPLDGIDLGNDANASFVDLDTDGDLDIITSGSLTYTTCPDQCFTYVNSTISVYRNDTGNFIDITGTPADKISNLAIQPAPNIKLIDVNGDGALDLVIPYFDAENFGSGSIQYFKNVSGTYVEQTGTSNPFSFFNSGITFNIDVADLDGDLDLDLIIGQPGATLKTYENTGTLADPVFTLNTTWDDGFLTTSLGTTNPVILDLDHDGDKDIIVGVVSNMIFYRNDGTSAAPSFTEFVPSSNENPFGGLTLSPLPSPSFVDLDGDGDKDLLTGDYYGQFSYFENSNPAPATALAPQTLIYNPISGSIVVDSNLTLTDSDNDVIANATIAIQNFQVGKELLDFTPQAGITGVFNTSTGVLTLSGLASVASYKTALQSVTYKFTGSKPAQSGRKSSSNGRTVTLARNIRFLVFDQDGTTPGIAQRQIQVTFPNVVPTIAASTTLTTFTGTAIIVDPGILAADGDDVNLEGATIQIGAATLQSGEDQLVFTNQNGITGSYNATVGTLTLTGIATLANYQDAVRSVRYNNTAGIPNPVARTITYLITDGESPSNTITIGLNVVVSDPPVLTGTNPNVTITPATGPVTIDSGITVTDTDNSTLQGATISITNFVTQDQLIFINQNGISGSYNSSSGVLTLTGSGSLANYQTALQSIQFNIGTTAYNLTSRSIQFIATDGSTNSAAVVSTVKVANQIPSIAGAASPITFTPSSGALVIANDLVLSDADNTNLQSAKVVISNFSAQDQLIFANQSGITGSYNTATGELTLSGDATVANYQSALRTVQFNNPSIAFALTNRTIEFSVSDGTTFSPVRVATVNVVNQVPALTLSQSVRVYTSGDLIVDNGLTLADADNTSLQSAEVTITTGRQAAEDVLLFANQSGITGNYTSATGVLNLTGATTLADYQNALRSIVYKNLSATPTKTARTITFRINDGTSFSTVASLTINFNSAPVINLSSLTGDVGQKLTVDLTPLITDSDNNISVSTIKILTQPTSGAIATINGSLLLTIDYQAFTFAGNDQLTIEACDAAGTCTQKIVTVTVNNSPPAINVTPEEAVVGGSLTINLTSLITDPNNNVDLSSLTISQQPISGAVASIDANKNLIVDYTGVSFVGADNLKIRVCDVVGACVEQTITIQVEGDIVVYDGISANGDDQNSYLELKNIVVLEPANKVSIYSRWGDNVFEMDNYNNTSRRFEGLTDNGKELPSGTYFYKVEFASGRKALTGYLTIKR